MSDLPTTTRGCARCGGDHDALEYRAFRRPVPDVNGDFTHWAPCPATGDPILMRVNDDLEAVKEQREGSVIVSAQRLADGVWVPLPVAATADLLRHSHEPVTWDDTWVYLGGGGPHE